MTSAAPIRQVLIVAALVTLAGGQASSQRPADQAALVDQLNRGSAADRARAVELVRFLGPGNTGPELRAALIAALDRAGRTIADRERAARRGDALEPLDDPEFIGQVSRVVAELQDPDAIPALAEALGTGFVVVRALAGFGEASAGAILDVVTSPQSVNYAVDHGLITLRLMVEQRGARPLSAETVEAIRQAAEQRLTSPGDHLASTGVTLRYAIDLAVVLGDPELRRAVESIASDTDEVVARGVTDPGLIAMTRKHAADRLAGVQPLPRQ